MCIEWIPSFKIFHFRLWWVANLKGQKTKHSGLKVEFLP